ncbi:hypothetical protein V8E53_011586 [Lactarius tabidus]
MQAYHGSSTRDEAPATVREDEDSVDKMWSGYMEEADRYDALVSDLWKDDANGVMVFLFSDSGVEAVHLLAQISQQLTVLSPNGTYTPPTPFPIYSPSLSIILVNSFWLLSLVLSIVSAVSATLMQQWARRYIRLPQIPSQPRDRARVRGFLFLGVLKYRMSRTFEAAGVLLHLAVFLFFAGLVIFFSTIFKAVAIVITVCVGLFVFLYLAITILPCIDYRCPYVTPMSNICWYCWHTLLGFFSLCARWLVNGLHGILVPYNAVEVTSPIQRILRDWWELLDDSVRKHGKRLNDGIQGTIIWKANDASAEVDPEALTWLLNGPAMADKSKIQEFVSSMPGTTIVQLFSSPVNDGKLFSQHLSALLQSCTPGSTGLDDVARRCRLLICLNAVHHIARAYSGAHHGVSLPKTLLEDVRKTLLEDVRINLADIRLMRTLWADTDPAIRVTSRSICALLARSILLTSPPRGSGLVWLCHVLRQLPNTIYKAHNSKDISTLDNMNVDSFVHGVLSNEPDDLPPESLKIFVDTLAILMNAEDRTAIRRRPFEKGLSELLRRVEDGRLSEVADKLRRISEAMFPSTDSEPKSEPAL